MKVDVRMTHAQLCAAPNLLDPKAQVTGRKSDFPSEGSGDWSALRVRIDWRLRRILDPPPRIAFALATSRLRIRISPRVLLVDEPLRYLIGPWRRLAVPSHVRYEDVEVQILPPDEMPMFERPVLIRFEAA